MMFTRDSGAKPDMPEDFIPTAIAMGMFPATIVCIDPDSPRESPSTIKMFARAWVLPRVGELLTLENNRHCQVVRIEHDIAREHDGCINLMPLIWCKLLSEEAASNVVT
jgi:hypothetical protein